MTLFVIGLARLWRRDARNAALENWVRSQPITYATRARVRIQAPQGGWVDYKNGLGRVMFVVRTNGIEVSLAGGMARIHGTTPGTERFLSAPDTTIWLDNIGLFGASVLPRKCIRLSGHDHNGSVELAVSPIGDIEEAWRALLDAGARRADGYGESAAL